jgi:hypothetical protein
MRDIAKAILGAGETEAEEGEVAAGGSLLGKLDLKALLGKKDKAKAKGKKEKAEAA